MSTPNFSFITCFTLLMSSRIIANSSSISVIFFKNLSRVVVSSLNFSVNFKSSALIFSSTAVKITSVCSARCSSICFVYKTHPRILSHTKEVCLDPKIIKQQENIKYFMDFCTKPLPDGKKAKTVFILDGITEVDEIYSIIKDLSNFRLYSLSF